MLTLLSSEFLPPWFSYPSALLDLLQTESIDVGPWQILHGEPLQRRNEGMKARFPSFQIVPFARRLDNDDVACFDISLESSNPKVRIVHDFCSPGWADRGEFRDFDAWFVAGKAEPVEWEE